MSDAKARAAHTLDHYITSVMQKAGMHVTQDTHVEIASIVDDIVEATKQSILKDLQQSKFLKS